MQAHYLLISKIIEFALGFEVNTLYAVLDHEIFQSDKKLTEIIAPRAKSFKCKDI